MRPAQQLLLAAAEPAYLRRIGRAIERLHAIPRAVADQRHIWVAHARDDETVDVAASGYGDELQRHLVEVWPISAVFVAVIEIAEFGASEEVDDRTCEVPREESPHIDRRVLVCMHDARGLREAFPQVPFVDFSD